MRLFNYICEEITRTRKYSLTESPFIFIFKNWKREDNGGGRTGWEEEAERQTYWLLHFALEIEALKPAGMRASPGMQPRANKASGHPHHTTPTPKPVLNKFCKRTLEGTPAGQISPNIVNFFLFF